MHFRSINIKGRKLTAYDLFCCHPEHFCAILEDPAGGGMQHLVSREGRRHVLSSTDQQAGSAFLDDWQRQMQAQQRHDSPCIANLVYAAYEAANLIESLPEPATAPPLCVLWSMKPEWSLCFSEDEVHLAASTERQMDMLLAMLTSQGERSSPDMAATVSPDVLVASDGDIYMQRVAEVKELIAAGDIFQANIARFWSLPFAKHDLSRLYARLRRVNPAPFSCMLHIDDDAGGDMHILSASPERLFRISPDGIVDTRPIAGTRRRGEGQADTQLRDELLLSDKERAEHIMLVDLERNDLGRVCVPGSVQVNETMAIEGYATVQHIVSNVQGRLRDGLDFVDVFRAMFPGGTITGCPKVRCMQIIHDMEGRARGPYTGGIGYTAWNGAADMNILIRSFWHYAEQLHWAAGAGIVADSDPEAELLETGHKAAGLMRALASEVSSY